MKEYRIKMLVNGEIKSAPNFEGSFENAVTRDKAKAEEWLARLYERWAEKKASFEKFSGGNKYKYDEKPHLVIVSRE